MENDDLILTTYTNILADITIGKNADKHLPFIKEGIEALNTRIGSEILAGNDGAPFIKLWLSDDVPTQDLLDICNPFPEV